MSKVVLKGAFSRREALRGLGTALLAIPLAEALACSGEAVTSASNSSSSSGSGSGFTSASSSSGSAGTTGSGSTSGSSSSSGSSGSSGTSGSALTGWATGGTAAMLARASYPDPFARGTGSTCTIDCEATIGPCHTTSPEVADPSQGWSGIPVRLSLKVVDSNCQPVQGALVEIWHTNYKGIYSGRINSMCNTAESDRAANYFRAYQVTDANGRVDFDTCFPGWYSSRAVHIHFRIQKGTYDASDSAQAWVISQFFFTDDLVKAIFANEPLYKDFGQPETLLTTDNVTGGTADKSAYVLDIQKLSDGAMLASKTIVLRAALTDSTCALTGAGSGGGSGGPGPHP